MTKKLIAALTVAAAAFVAGPARAGDDPVVAAAVARREAISTQFHQTRLAHVQQRAALRRMPPIPATHRKIRGAAVAIARR